MNKIAPRRSELLGPFNSMFEDFANRFFEDGFFGQPVKLLEGIKHKAYPKMNIYTKDNNLVVEASVPGLTKKDIKVNLEGNLLTISGKKEVGENVEEDNYFYKELSYSAFSRSIQLPEDVDVEALKQLKAKVNNGLLKIEIPYKSKNKPVSKEIEIEEAITA